MSFNRQVCKAFFILDSELNKGHGIISSIYALIERTRSSDEQYFDALERRISKEAIGMKTQEAYFNLLILCWKFIPEGSSKWANIAHWFYTTDLIDGFARKSLGTTDYSIFQSKAENTLCYELDLKYDDLKTRFAWDLFNIREKTAKIIKKDVSFTDLLIIGAGVYSAYKLFLESL